MKKYITIILCVCLIIAVSIYIKSFTYAQNNDVTSKENIDDENKVLGTLEELFSGEHIRNKIIEELRRKLNNYSIDKSYVVKQSELNMINSFEVYGDIKNEYIKNLHLLKNLDALYFTAGRNVEDWKFIWEKISELKNLEYFKIESYYDVSTDNSKVIIDVPYLPKLKNLNIYNLGLVGYKYNAMWGLDPGYIFDGSSINEKNLPALETLDISGTPLKSYDSIANISSLKYLRLAGQFVKDIKFIEKLQNLESLNLEVNSISDFSPIGKLDKLKYLYSGDQYIYYYKEFDNEIKYYTITGEQKLPVNIKDIDGTDITMDSIVDFHFEADRIADENLYKEYDPIKKVITVKGINANNIITGNMIVPLLVEAPVVNGINLEDTFVAKDKKMEMITFSLPSSRGIRIMCLYEIDIIDGAIPINNAPTILADDREILIGGNFNPLDGVTVTDKEDGIIELTEDNILENNVDVNVAGNYRVVISVVDSEGAKVQKTINIKVIEKEDIIIDEKPIIKDNSGINNMPKTGYDMNTEKFIVILLVFLSGMLILNFRNKKRIK